MSWSYPPTVSKDKDKLKADCRTKILANLKQGTAEYATAAKVADQIAATLDLFFVKPGQVIQLAASGSLVDGVGSYNLSISNAGSFVE